MEPTNIPPTPAPTTDPASLPVIDYADLPQKFTVAQYNNLKAAYASGARQIQYGDQIVMFQSSNVLRDILARMEVELGIRTASQRVYPGFNKGLR